ncbi:excinuclease ABC subunit UvrC [Pantoea sp. Aalb]|uniref:excinuclease ABC subunit UvrC n=1 Tax=Pantoea sp. Aalb TaxID=2576762 RepID=UPI001328DCC1|nr:excinuclease ABC subunit UvrC [Pantoea sp. Aalb]MXP67475.1 excinuclease ABC subunit UvrC [Pantoea sp. Aalb]
MKNIFNFKEFLSHLTTQPGVYRMYNKNGIVIYVGKAKNLKNRLSSYFYSKINNRKIEILVNNIQSIDVIVTQTETEALLLEYNYIKLYQPRYNVVFRDDKSYTYIFLSNDKHPRITMHRGTQNKKGEYFGPFSNRFDIQKLLKLIQKIFPIRQCKNNVYRIRSRPCLQYQIGRCLGPCISGLVDEQEYKVQTNYVRMFLTGKSNKVIDKIVTRMEKASIALHFEEADRLYSQIKEINTITEKHCIFKNIFLNKNYQDNIDVIGLAYDYGIICLHMLFIRHGKVLRNSNHFLELSISTELMKVIQKFITDFYFSNKKTLEFPNSILIHFNLPKANLLEDLLSKIAGHKINIQYKLHINDICYLKLAKINAMNALKSYISQSLIIKKRFIALATFLKIDNINRIECFDISHTMGEYTTASCVAYNKNGPVFSDYRHFNIDGILPGDDCAAIKQVLFRRYNKNIEKNKIPDLILIDGGKGQLLQAENIFSALKVSWNKDHPVLLAISKGKYRKTGLETLFLKTEGKGIFLPHDSPELHIIQHIRNAAHNYALSSHQKKQVKIQCTSSLERIKGIGPKRRQKLLKYMGGLQSLINASVEDIIKVPGISFILAKKIYHSLNY